MSLKAKSSAPNLVLPGAHAEPSAAEKEIAYTTFWSQMVGAVVIVGTIVVILAMASDGGDRLGAGASVVVQPHVEAVSWKDPRVFIHHGFLSEAECDYIIEKGLDIGIERSKVVGHEDDVVSKVRTSSGVFIFSTNDPILQRIEERVAIWSQLPVENQEAFYLLQYHPGEKYEAHHDYFEGPAGQRYIGDAGQRTATVLMYLSDPEEGGETFFPLHENALRVQPKKGDAVLFYSTKPDGSMDNASLHGSAPVRKGVKYALTKWIRVKKFM
eukprot:TRINITY_DN25490_c0_g1_i1.p1 TRINITY_DN25490_c0_g1~~TRINITY_DN25490_c0_g1_i1.p1  ORF type:complete len:280 (+),score=94.71 TRINITY_DN25490_c0_g1_i1:33-842(+)